MKILASALDIIFLTHLLSIFTFFPFVLCLDFDPSDENMSIYHAIFIRENDDFNY